MKMKWVKRGRRGGGEGRRRKNNEGCRGTQDTVHNGMKKDNAHNPNLSLCSKTTCILKVKNLEECNQSKVCVAYRVVWP
jgi:hypothetical protein